MTEKFLCEEPSRILTSRECAKIICGSIPALIALFGEKYLPPLVAYFLENNELFFKALLGPSVEPLVEISRKRAEFIAQAQGRDSLPELSGAEILLGGTVGCLATMTTPENLRSALLFVQHHQGSFADAVGSISKEISKEYDRIAKQSAS